VQSLGRTALGVLIVLLTVTAQAGRVQAQCVPPAASVTEGEDVTCSGPITDAYTVPTTPSPVNEVTVTIEAGASFDVDGPHAVSINDLGRIINNGTVNVGTDGSAGLVAGSNSLIEHFGEVNVSGDGATGFVLGAGSNFGQDTEPQTPGTISLSAESAVGISGSDTNVVLSWGNINSTADKTTGIWLTNGSGTTETKGEARNRGEMNFFGSESKGIVSGNHSISANSEAGTLNFEGANSTAIESGDFGRSFNLGTIVMDGDESTALRTGNGESLDPDLFSAAFNSGDGSIELSGEKSIGIEVGRFGFARNYGELSVTGSNSTAISIGPESYIQNIGTIRVSGAGSIGVKAKGRDLPDPPPIDAPVLANVDGASLVSEDPEAGPLVKLEKGARESRVTNIGSSNDGLDTPSLISAYVNPTDPTLDPGVAIEGSEGADRIINGADIRGLVLLGDGEDIYESYITGRITDLGSGTLDGGDGTDTLDLTVDPDGPSSETGFFDLGLVQNFEKIRVSGGRWELSRTPSANTNLVVASGGTLRIETPLSIPGDYSHEAPTEPSAPLALVEVVLTAENEGLGEALLQIEGTADLSNGELEIEVVRDPTSGDFPSGDLLLVESGGVLSGEFDSVSEPPGTLTYTEHKLMLELVAMNANQTATSNYIESVPTTGLNPQLKSFLDTIKDLSYPDYLSALDQLMPEAYDAQADATLELANQYTDLLLSRPNYCVVKPGEDSVHPTTQLACQTRAFEPWMNLYGQRHKRTGTDGHISYHDEGGGLVVGFDHRVNHQLLLTASAGVAYDIIHVDNVGKGRLGTVDIGFAASWADGPLRIQGAATYGYGWNTRYREIDITGFQSRARSEYGMNRVGLRARAEYGFRLGHLQIAPLVSLDYTALIRPSITETEGGAANLYIDGTTNNITTVRVGFDLGSALHKDGYWTELLENADGVWRPQLTVAWRQVVTGAHRQITSRLLEAPTDGTFTIEANAADQGFEVGAGLDWSPALINRFTFGVHYDAFVWKNVLNQTIMGQVRFSF
jgi:uncharacterized protein with beta-barrel porin domain